MKKIQLLGHILFFTLIFMVSCQKEEAELAGGQIQIQKEFVDDLASLDAMHQNFQQQDILISEKKGGQKKGNGNGGGKGGGNNGGGGHSCTEATYCVKVFIDGTLAGCEPATNCDDTGTVIISSSSGPNNNMTVDLGDLPVNPCSFSMEGCDNCNSPLVLQSDETGTFYFKPGEKKYAWNIQGDGSYQGQFPPENGSTAVFELVSYSIDKDGPHNKSCLVSSTLISNSWIEIRHIVSGDRSECDCPQ